MGLVERLYNPFVRTADTTRRVMTDVIIALLPCVAMTWFAYGMTAIMVTLTAVGSAMLGEFLFNALLRCDTRSVGDGSAIVTGILLSFTIGPFTPLPIVAVGGACAVIFGKLLWGGVGRNRFNPALIGREFIVVLFPAVMNSSAIWNNREILNTVEINLFGDQFWNRLFYWPTGAMGEYAPMFLLMGGVWLLLRRRISWHIPVAMIAAFTVALLLLRGEGISFTRGGLLLGAIYMATDMPTSSSTKAGKLYFGAMAGILALVCILFGAQRGYLSYSILIMNAFVVPINWVFRPRTWGKRANIGNRLWQGILLTLAIAVVTAAVLWLDSTEAILWPILAYAVYTVLRFALSDKVRPWGRVIKIMSGSAAN